MNQAQGRVTLGHGVQQNTKGHQIINLFKGKLLGNHLVVDTVKALVTPHNPTLEPRIFHEGSNGVSSVHHFLFSPQLIVLHQLLKPFVLFRIEGGKGDILQLLLQGVDAQTRSDGHVKIHGFLSDAALFGLLLMKSNGAHVVETVGQLDENHADVVGHRQDHLSNALGLALFRRRHVELAQLGDAIDHMADALAEVFGDLLFSGMGVFNDIVKKGGCHTLHVQLHVCQNIGHFQWMSQIRLSGQTRLSVMDPRRKDVGTLHDVQIGIGMVLKNSVQNIINSNHTSPGFANAPRLRLVTFAYGLRP